MTIERKQEIALRDKSYLLASDIVRPMPKDFEHEGFGYGLALHMTGVTVLGWEAFDSYQGDWWAYVEFPNGERYFVHDYYGSCSGCDAFQGASNLEERKYNHDTGKYEENPAYAHNLRDFGREYLTDCMTAEQALEEASKNLQWDHDAEAMVQWIKDQINGTTSKPLTIEGTSK